MMGRSTPTLGYPTKTAAVIALRQSGLMTREIAERVGISTSAVSALENTARKRASQIEAPPAVSSIRMAKVEDYFSIEHQTRLRPHADRRKMSLGLLIKTIVRTIAEGDLVDAVLDDEEIVPHPVPAALPLSEPEPEPGPELEPEPVAPKPVVAPAPLPSSTVRRSPRDIDDGEMLMQLLRRAPAEDDGSALFMASVIAKRMEFTTFRLDQVLEHLAQLGEIKRRACSLKDHFRVVVRRDRLQVRP